MQQIGHLYVRNGVPEVEITTGKIPVESKFQSSVFSLFLKK